MAHKGHTGVEGRSTQVVGALATLVGFIWAILAFFLRDAASAVVLPALILAGGIVTFFVGRNMAKANAGSGG